MCLNLSIQIDGVPTSCLNKRLITKAATGIRVRVLTSKGVVVNGQLDT